MSHHFKMYPEEAFQVMASLLHSPKGRNLRRQWLQGEAMCIFILQTRSPLGSTFRRQINLFLTWEIYFSCTYWYLSLVLLFCIYELGYPFTFFFLHFFFWNGGFSWYLLTLSFFLLWISLDVSQLRIRIHFLALSLHSGGFHTQSGGCSDWDYV